MDVHAGKEYHFHEHRWGKEIEIPFLLSVYMTYDHQMKCSKLSREHNYRNSLRTDASLAAMLQAELFSKQCVQPNKYK